MMDRGINLVPAESSLAVDVIADGWLVGQIKHLDGRVLWKPAFDRASVLLSWQEFDRVLAPANGLASSR
jgi:hypothetical protein